MLLGPILTTPRKNSIFIININSIIKIVIKSSIPN